MHAMAPPPEVVAHPANNARDTVDDEQTHPAASLGTHSPLQHDAFTRLPARGSAASACILLLTASVLGAVTRQVARLATRVAQATAAAATAAAASALRAVPRDVAELCSEGSTRQGSARDQTRERGGSHRRSCSRTCRRSRRRRRHHHRRRCRSGSPGRCGRTLRTRIGSAHP